MTPCIWSEYVRYRARLRNFDLELIERILRYSEERYLDTVTHRMVAVGKHGSRLVMVPYEQKEDAILAVTIHATTRKQVKFRVKSGRFTHAAHE